jgi:Zn-dependent protease with chaperone function
MTLETLTSPPLLTFVDVELALGSARSARVLSSPEELELRLARGYRKGWLLLGALAAGCVGLTALALLHPLPLLPLLVPIGAVMILDWRRWVHGKRRDEHPLHSAPAELLGTYTRETVAELVQDASSRFPPGEQPAVFVRESRLANAGANNSWLFDHLPHHNAIFLHSHVLHAFDREELRAIVLHELSHFHRHMEPASRNVGFVLLSRIPLLAGLLSALFSPVWPLHLLLSGLVYLCQSRALRQSTSLSETRELACDAQAAALGGALPAINALLKIAERDQLAGSILSEAEVALSRHSPAEVVGAYQLFRFSWPRSRTSRSPPKTRWSSSGDCWASPDPERSPIRTRSF